MTDFAVSNDMLADLDSHDAIGNGEIFKDSAGIAHNSNVTLTNRPASNESAFVKYDSAGVCRAKQFYNGTHFVMTGSC